MTNCCTRNPKCFTCNFCSQYQRTRKELFPCSVAFRASATSSAKTAARQTDEAYTGGTGYFDLSTVPVSIRGEDDADETPASIADRDFTKRRPSRIRHDRDGRPPNKWLCSLRADELRIWLKTISVPEAGVEGMTYLVHLTRDHLFNLSFGACSARRLTFNEANVKPLTIDEQATLHAAAHFDY